MCYLVICFNIFVDNRWFINKMKLFIFIINIKYIKSNDVIGIWINSVGCC